jgi:hypothetical protein
LVFFVKEMVIESEGLWLMFIHQHGC